MVNKIRLSSLLGPVSSIPALILRLFSRMVEEAKVRGEKGTDGVMIEVVQTLAIDHSTRKS